MKSLATFPRISPRTVMGVCLALLLACPSLGIGFVKDVIIVHDVWIASTFEGWITESSEEYPGVSGRLLTFKVVALGPEEEIGDISFDRPEVVDVPVAEDGWFALDLPEGVYAFEIDFSKAGFDVMIGTLIITSEEPAKPNLVIQSLFF